MSNDDAYYARRGLLLAELDLWWDGAYCDNLASRLRWSSAEVRGKLASLRADGFARYDADTGIWRATRARP